MISKRKLLCWALSISCSLSLTAMQHLNIPKSVHTPVSTASTIVDISGLDKAAVIKALFEEAVHGNYYPSATHLSEAALNHALTNLSDIDYLAGRPLKVNLSGDTFDCFLYNRDNGAEAAQRAIAKLRAQLG